MISAFLAWRFIILPYAYIQSLTEMMFELYLDTANVSEIQALSRILPTAGVTTNPSIMAAEGRGLKELLPALVDILGVNARFHVQVISAQLDNIIEEARQLNDMPFDIVVKIPAHANGLAAIKQLKRENIPVLATAIYNVQQGIMAAFHGADYLAPYVNRIDNQGFDGIGVVADLQELIERYELKTKLLVASFKNVQQVLSVLRLGVGAVTLPADIARQMISTPATDLASKQFEHDWHACFGDRLSFET